MLRVPAAAVLLTATLNVLFTSATSIHVAARVNGQPANESQHLLVEEQDRRGKPNIIFILTDDQDLHMSSLDYMPHLQEHLVKEGTSFRHHYVTAALCCPSRAILWTGKHAHNTNVTDVSPPHGGYPKFVSQGFNDNYLPLWMQSAGYDTYYVGKLWNSHSVSNYDKPHARGWTNSDFLLDPYTYEYLNATMQRNVERRNEEPVHEAPRSYEGQYTTDVLAEKAYEYLDQALHERYHNDPRSGSRTPFFLTIAPTAPHSNVHINIDLSDGHSNFTENTVIQSPPIAAKRHEHLFPDAVVPRTPDFNPDKNNTVHWMKSLLKQNESNIDSNDHFYRQRLRALQAVDEMVPEIVKRLEHIGALDETYIVFSTDNGYHIGQHRLQPGKQCAFETDINVPMIVRGPGVGRGEETDIVSSHVDLAPTFLKLAGVDLRSRTEEYALDGAPIPVFAHNQAVNINPVQLDASIARNDLHPSVFDDSSHRQEHVNIEMWGVIMPEGKYGMILYPNHTYKALRVIAVDESYNLLYVVWCNNDHELYDLKHDPYALHNLVESPIATNSAFLDISSSPLSDIRSAQVYQGIQSISGAGERIDTDLQHLIDRVDALLMVLKTCKGRQCTHPWEQLHPHPVTVAEKQTTIQSLRDALHADLDEFYRNQVEKVRFEQCEQAYIMKSEGPMWKGIGSEETVFAWPEALT